jgi:acyl-CoA dehydrogenase
VNHNDLVEPFERLLASASAPAAVRAIESGACAHDLWDEIAASGFLDALVDESAGGASLAPVDVEPLFEQVGTHAVPLPVAETMVARALLAKAGITAPEGPIVLVTSIAQPVPCGMLASHALVDNGHNIVLSEMSALVPESFGVHHGLSALITAPKLSDVSLPRPADGLRPLAAAVRAALIAGAAARLTVMTANYANERSQFGKPIGRQQAVQHMLAVMAEDMIACRIAAQLGLSSGLNVPATVAAAAKTTTSAAAARIAATAHAVHGAIGISEEYDLQLLTRRLHEWRLADGSEGYWATILGQSRLTDSATSISWVRSHLFDTIDE